MKRKQPTDEDRRKAIADWFEWMTDRAIIRSIIVRKKAEGLNEVEEQVRAQRATSPTATARGT